MAQKPTQPRRLTPAQDGELAAQAEAADAGLGIPELGAVAHKLGLSTEAVGTEVDPDGTVVLVMRVRLEPSVDELMARVERFNREIVGTPTPVEGPCVLGQQRQQFRVGHLREEVQEFDDATNAGDTEQASDALLDLIYVALGTLFEMGVNYGPTFDRVHAANMAKVRGEVSKRPGSAGFDAIKPEGWTPPDNSWILDATPETVALGLAAKRHDLTVEVLEEISPAFIHCARVRAGKGRDYNTSVALTDYFPNGHASYFQLQWMKTLRTKSILELMGRGMVPNYEGLLDTLYDQLNYVSFWVEAIVNGDLPITGSRGAKANGAVQTKC